MGASRTGAPTYPVARALPITIAAGLLGLPTLLFEFPSVAFSLVTIAWKLGTMCVLVAALRVFEKRAPDAAALGLAPVGVSPERDRTLAAVPAVAAMLAVAFWWSQIPGLRSLSAAGNASSYGAVGALGTGVLAFELLVRYPIVVVAEESFFRGFLQPRLRTWAPVLGGVLFAIYHLQQWQTIPSLVPFGIALGLLRWWLGSIWPGVVFHYVGNAMFILSLRS